MSYKVTDFPQYRKLSNEKVYYCIHDERRFDEIQIIGTRAQRFTTNAEKYPEILRIQDMLNDTEGAFILSSEEEYNRVLEDYNIT